MKSIFILFLCVFSTSILAKPQIDVVISPNICTIGDSFVYKLDLRLDKQDQLIEVPDRVDFSENESLEFTRSGAATTIYQVRKTINEDSRRIEIDYPMRIYDLGPQTIPTQQVTLLLGAKKKLVKLTIPAKTIDVQSVRHIDDVSARWAAVFYSESLDRLSVVLICLSVLGAIIVLLVAWMLVKKYRQKDLEEPAVIDNRTSLQKAEDAFTDLFKQDLFKKQRIKDHYVALTEIIKQYLFEQYAIQLLDLTSTETLAALTNIISSEDLKRLKYLLSLSDTIKYAKQLPSEDDHRDTNKKALDFVRRLDASIPKKPVVKTEEASL